jgi:hypothetical protein
MTYIAKDDAPLTLMLEKAMLDECTARTKKPISEQRQCDVCGCTYYWRPEPWLKTVTESCPWCPGIARAQLKVLGRFARTRT